MSTAVGITFTETMRGYVSYDGPVDCRAAYRAGRKSGTRLSFTLAVDIDDVAGLGDDPMQAGRLRGTVTSGPLGDRLAVVRGDFNLFVAIGTDVAVDIRHMRYRLFFLDQSGRPLTLTGYKVVKNTGLRHVWRDTSTLFVTILHGHVDAVAEPAAEVLGAGILRIPILSFAKQMTTMRGVGGGPLDKGRALAAFGRHFMGTLREIYLPSRTAAPRASDRVRN